MTTMERSAKKRVDFSVLGSIDSSAPEEASAPWDSETDHLLSYFLGDSSTSNSHTNSAVQDFGSSVSTSVSGASPLHPHHPHHPHSHPHVHTTNHAQQTNPHASKRRPNSPADDDPPTPRTPATQFYASTPSSSHPSVPIYSSARQANAENYNPGIHPGLTSSSPASSISSIAASLVSGGPVLHHQVKHQHHHRGHGHGHGHVHLGHPLPGATASFENASPISPAAMIGTPQENLMLPPPSRTPPQMSGAAPGAHGSSAPNAKTSTNANPNADTNTNASAQDGHIEWLKQINAMAKAASNHGSVMPAPMMMVPPHQHPRHQPPPLVQQQQHVHHATQPTGTPGITMPPTAATHGMHTFPTAPGYPPHPAASLQSPMMYTQAALSQMHHRVVQSAGESKEKRARRLERNRESARKSRRRKKERLAMLEKMVDKLHNQIEEERKKQINSMLGVLMKSRKDEIARICKDPDKNNEASQDDATKLRDDLVTAVKYTGCGNNTSEPIVEFQYNTLKQFLLPRYQNFLLWLTLHPESYFTAGKEEYARREGKQVLRISSGRVSSKQIGDELTNGWKKNEKEKSSEEESNNVDNPDAGEKTNPTCRALNAPRMWPLLCYELSISVDQEERILQSLKRMQHMENLPDYRSQLAAATKMASSLREAVAFQCTSASLREDRVLLEILTPAQLSKYQKWISEKKDRYDRLLNQTSTQPKSNSTESKETSLCDVCKRLEEVLRIGPSQK